MPNQQPKTKGVGSPNWKKIVYDALIELGLERKELDLYTASMELGPSTISRLASHMNLSKPSIYKLIEQLSVLGLASPPSRSGNRSTFTVAPATEILMLLKRKRERYEYLQGVLTAAVPEIVASQNRFVRQANIQMYRGRIQLNVLHDSVLDDQEANLRFFGSPISFRGIFTKAEYDAWTMKKVRSGIWNKVLIPASEERTLPPNPEAAMREIRVFKERSPFSTIFQLFSNKVIFWWPETEAALLVDDSQLFGMMDSIFSTYWESAMPLQAHRENDDVPPARIVAA